MCVRVRAPLVPCHSWLGCPAWSCVLGLGFRLRPATSGWVVGFVCVCVPAPLVPRHSWLGCGVGVCAWARVSAAPCHSWLGCWGVCVFVCALRLYPATPGFGERVGRVCLGSGFSCVLPLLAWVLGCLRIFRARSSCTPPLLAGMCGVGVCAWAWASAAPRDSWLGCWGACVCVCPLRLWPATPGWGVWCVCVCLGWGFSCALPLLAGVLGCVCVRVPTPLVPRHSWLGCLGLCVCAWSRVSAAPRHSWLGCWGVCVCAWAQVSAALRHSWLACWGVCVFVCPLLLYAATPGSGVWCGCVCLGSGFGCPPPLLAWVLGCVCVRVRAPPVPRHSWLGFVVWVCVLGLGLRLRPATPGWGVGVRACLCARSACGPPLLAGVCGVCVCVWAEVSAAPCHSWLGCCGVCVFVCPLRFYPATPGWGVGLCVCVLGLGFRLRPATPGWGVGVCVCSCGRSSCTTPLLVGMCGVAVCCWALGLAAPRHSWLGCSGVCVFVCALRLYPATPGWAVRFGCVCLGSGFGCSPPLLAGVLGCVCVPVPAPLVPRHSWLGCVVWVCVLGLGFRLRPATPGLGVGGVCVLVRAPPVPRHSWLGFVVWVCVFWLGFRLRPATPGRGVWVCVCLCASSAPPKRNTTQQNTTQHNTTQRNTTHYNTTQQNTTQHNTTQHNTTQHNTTQHNTTQHNTTQHNTTQHNTTQHNTTQHNPPQRNTTQHNTTQHNGTHYNTSPHNTTQGFLCCVVLCCVVLCCVVSYCIVFCFVV